MSGYFGIGIYNTKTLSNIGTLWRSAYLFGASFIFTIGKRYKHQASDTLKAPRHIPLYDYIDFKDFKKNIPFDCEIIAIEKNNSSKDIYNFIHPKRTIYLLGAEDYGLPEEVLNQCNNIVHIQTNFSLNVSVAGSIIMFHRQQQFLK